MRRAILALAFLLTGVAACDARQPTSPAASPQGSPAGAPAALPHAGVMASLRRTLTGAGRFDDAPITGVEQVSACATAFVTDKGRTVVDWSAVQNPAAHTESGSDILPLAGGAQSHTLAVPLTPEVTGRRMEASVGLLYADCKGK